MEYTSAEGFTVRVLRADLSGAAGVGFIVGDGRIVTCAHVVNAALGREKTEQTEPKQGSLIKVDFPLLDGAESAGRRDCRLRKWLPPPQPGISGRDLAVLELAHGALPAKAGPARLMDPAGARNASVQIFGYPDLRSDPRPEGVRATLRMAGGVGGGLIQLDDDGDAAFRAQEGFSGSPVVAKDAGGDAVIGIFAVASVSKQARDSYAIPVSALLNAWPGAADSVAVPERPYWVTGYGAPAWHAAYRNDDYGIPLPPDPQVAVAPIRELPMAPLDFSGRSKESKRLIDWLSSGGGTRLVNIYGIPGSGKTALALHAAQAVSHEFPDCQLYFNLRASDQSPVPAETLLGQQLVQLGMPNAEVPTGLQARAQAYRSLLSRFRSLIVIVNATAADQVESLLPGAYHAAVIVTSWTLIPKIPGGQALRLQPLGDADALEMLEAVSDRQIADADRTTARQVARLLGNLPLALRSAGGLLRTREHWTWQTLYTRLCAEAANPQARPVVIGSREVQASFELAYRELDQTTALAYRLLGLAPSARMSKDLAQALISDDLFEAEDIVDQLVDHQLLQPEAAAEGAGASEPGAFRMHDLLWLRARSLVTADDDREARDAAQQRMTKWSLTQLGTRYPERLKSSLAMLPSVLNDRKLMSLTDTYVDSTVVSADHLRHSVPPATLSGLFPDRFPRLVLTAPGGSGKTTMAGYLCLRAASGELGTLSGDIIPLIVLIRDIRPDTEDTGLESLIIRTLRYRYDCEVTPDALRVALDGGRVFVIADGLDEIMPGIRQRVIRSINEFADRFRRVPVLVTTRPFAAVGQAFSTFTIATIASWTPNQATAYLEKLSRTRGASLSASGLINWLDTRRDLGLIGTPLGLQLLLNLYLRQGVTPETFTTLLEGILQQVISGREETRGLTWQGSPDELRDALEHVAFAMQSNPDNRITITEQDIALILERAGTRGPGRAGTASMVTNSRFGVMVEIGTTPDGEEIFAFTHTAFREHLAANCLARMPLAEVQAVMRAHYADPSWEAVFVTAFELAGRNWPVTSVVGNSHPLLRDAIRSWAQRAGQ
jgi:hypothetical protein